MILALLSPADFRASMMIEATAAKCRVFLASADASSVRQAQVLEFESPLSSHDNRFH